MSSLEAKETGTKDGRGKERVRDLAELHASEDASRLEDAVGFFEDERDVGAVADAEGDGVEVDGGGRDGGGERLCVAVGERDLRACERKGVQRQASFEKQAEN